MPESRNEATETALDARGITVRYPQKGSHDFTAVDRASLRVRRGQITALVGESGSGKSSLGLVCAGLHKPGSGSVLVAGNDLATLEGASLRRLRLESQMIFQNPKASLTPGMTIGSGLRELQKLHPERSEWTSPEALLERVGLPRQILSWRADRLSGGQSQRVAVARAVLLRPSVLVADEPTSALDVSVQAQIVDLLDAIRAEMGVGILFITHDLPLARTIAHETYVMHRGTIVESGSTESVWSNPQHEHTRALVRALGMPTSD